MLIADLYHSKVKTILPNTTVQESLKRMMDEQINAFIVVDANEHVVGILSLQDIAAATVPEEFQHNSGMAKAMYVQGFFHQICQNLKDRPISEVMRKKFITVDLQTNILAIMSDFLEHDLYVVPVMDGDKLLGVITRTEVKRALAKGMHLL